ncbi:hypothetical protein QFZ76_004797 [Streptomyces sp. V4I2]|nr:hypothetical protein [Streptomyces sp. V4I2]
MASEEWLTMRPLPPTLSPSSSPSPPTLGYVLFATRWLQAPLYFGLVVVQGVYVYKFFNELWTLPLRRGDLRSLLPAGRAPLRAGLADRDR